MLPDDGTPDRPGVLPDEVPDEDAGEKPSFVLWGYEVTRQDLVGAAVVAVAALILAAWWGLLLVLVIFGAAAGAFLGALLSPHVGGDVVLDDLRIDLLKCLALGAYLVIGFAAVVFGLRALVVSIHGAEAPVFVSGGLLVLFLFTVGLLARMLWLENDRLEAVVITLATIIGAVITLTFSAGFFVGR